MVKADTPKIVIVGAGAGGLAAAIALGAAGYRVLVLEAADGPGGKLRQVTTAGQAYDAGPTVLTMKWVFDALLARCGLRLEDGLGLTRADVIARHYWKGGACLDLVADPEESRRAIGDFAGARNAEGFRRFAEDSARVFALLRDSFIDAARPNPVSLSNRIGLHRPGALFALQPFTTLWSALGRYFPDPRLRQLFGRYATYCGSSPFLSPATLMLVAHVEQDGLWLVEGGMHALARRLAAIAEGLGVTFRYGASVRTIRGDSAGRAVTGVELESGQFIPASQVIYNGDAAALGALLGQPAQPQPAGRSLSALVVCGPAKPRGVPLAHHTVFFSEDYRGEFEAIFRHGRPPEDPTIYLCAQDRDASGRLKAGRVAGEAERLYALMNMPADGDRRLYQESDIERCLTAMDRRLAANGLTAGRLREAQIVTTPDRFAALYPGSGGALYGRASHGWMASFSRPGSRGPLQGLYLAGGSVHPGPGVPMAALSGKLAADRLMADMGSTGRSRLAATAGGMSMR
ncbi:1-hydroxycarotenoid 3,4-desaturase CrtD [Oceanibaculum indicum]|uniref:Phytoene desaturase n=1 Tax=Oceanibaculum indicum P24 TaxID=1207063 RepID=K2K053_9PROT|nr:1-hydroxycarotenoid 3,4-desaturase CrtD [Oceanibaculum indicum]EKE76069.1 phytoene desaturase [Oceanibaculum indicum P24]